MTEKEQLFINIKMMFMFFVDRGSEQGYLLKEEYDLPEENLIRKANDICNLVNESLSDSDEEMDPIEVPIRFSAYAGMAFYCIRERDNKQLNEQEFNEFIIKPRGICCMDEYIMDDLIGVGFESEVSKCLAIHFYESAFPGLSYAGKCHMEYRNAVCQRAMFLYGMVVAEDMLEALS